MARFNLAWETARFTFGVPTMLSVLNFRRASFAALTLLAAACAFGHGAVSKQPVSERVIHFPATEGYETLVLDLHTHSVFSDGHVWPTIRIGEAARDGLDGIAITEHLEWQPHLTDIPNPDRNRAFDIAAEAASNLDLMVIPGIEITRSDQPGHMNAVFVKDANALVRQLSALEHLPEHIFDSRAEAEDFAKTATDGGFGGAHAIDVGGMQKWIPFDDDHTYFTLIAYTHAAAQPAREVLELANDQGAFTFWNHPNFSKPRAKMDAFHKEAVKAGLLHGIEIANGGRYYENAHRLALKHNLTFIGTSDVHNLIDWDYTPTAGGHRPVTLAFAKERSLEGAREALVARRTIVWWKDTLIGRPPELSALLRASIKVEQATWSGETLRVSIRNHSDATLKLQNATNHIVSRHGPVIELAANDVTRVDFRLAKRKLKVGLEFLVLNALQAPGKPMAFSLSVDTE